MVAPRERLSPEVADRFEEKVRASMKAGWDEDRRQGRPVPGFFRRCRLIAAEVDRVLRAAAGDY